MALKTPQNKNLSGFDKKFYAHQIGAASSKYFSNTSFEAEIQQIQELIELGVARVAEEKTNSLLKLKPRDVNLLAKLRLFLSRALELQARYEEALDVLKMYASEEVRLPLNRRLDLETQAQIALLYNYLANAPKAISLLKNILEQATADNTDKQLIGLIKASLSRSYRAVGQSKIARDFAVESLEVYREIGDRRGMTHAYTALSTIAVQENKFEESIELCHQIINIVGSRPEHYVLGRAYTDMAAAYTITHRPVEGIACLEKSARYFEQTEHTANVLVAYNNLGLNLIRVGNWVRAEKTLHRALKIAVEINHKSLPVIYDSLGELYLLREDFDEAEKCLRRAVEVSQIQNRQWYLAQALHNWGRYHQATKKYKRAGSIVKQYIETAEALKHHSFIQHAHLQLADIYRQQEEWDDFETEINLAKPDEDHETDLYIAAYYERLKGLAAQAKNDSTLAEYHLSRGLSMYEVIHDYYHSALCRYELGTVLSETNPKTAAEYFEQAIENFLYLQIKRLLEQAKTARANLKTTAVEIKHPAQNIGLLTTRLAEAATSRELLFHELLSILQKESRARKILIARPSDSQSHSKLSAVSYSGFTAAESEKVLADLQRTKENGNLSEFSEANNFAVIEMPDTGATPSFLLIFPRSGARLSDNSSLKPIIKTVELGLKICSLQERHKTQKTLVESERLKVESPLPGFIHSSPGMQTLVEEIYKIRTSDITVLITGESGTGKELVSRAVHQLSNRKDQVFVPFNCTAMPKDLAEGHLFGYRKGAFTGATQDSPGVIRSADGGTLFLDEIGDLPLDVQPKLLRFLQEGEIQPLGEKNPIKVDVRVVAATNVSLESKVADGTFREDLYYRLNVIRLRIPPLRERRSEIPLLVNHYLNHYSTQYNKQNVTITPQTVDLLMVCDWVGNIRQLCNELQRIVVRADDNEIITPERLSPELRRTSLPLSQEPSSINLTDESSAAVFSVKRETGTLDEVISQIESRVILEALQRHNGNVSRVARELDISRRNLYMKLERYNLIKPNNPLSKFNIS